MNNPSVIQGPKSIGLESCNVNLSAEERVLSKYVKEYNWQLLDGQSDVEDVERALGDGVHDVRCAAGDFDLSWDVASAVGDAHAVSAVDPSTDKLIVGLGATRQDAIAGLSRYFDNPF